MQQQEERSCTASVRRMMGDRRGTGGRGSQPSVNITFRHGVRQLLCPTVRQLNGQSHGQHDGEHLRVDLRPGMTDSSIELLTQHHAQGMKQYFTQHAVCKRAHMVSGQWQATWTTVGSQSVDRTPIAWWAWTRRATSSSLTDRLSMKATKSTRNCFLLSISARMGLPVGWTS